MEELQEIKEIHDKKPRAKHYRDMRAKLIFNPSAGAARGSPIGILDVIHEMQAWKLVPEAFLVEAGCDLPGAVRDALAQGIRMFVVCGGDGTVSAVARILAGTHAALGIIPIGTQNNTALSLGIPTDIAGRHRNPAHGPPHQSGHWHGHPSKLLYRRRRTAHALLGALLGGAGLDAFPIYRRCPTR